MLAASPSPPLYHKRLIVEHTKATNPSLDIFGVFKLRTQGFLVQRRDTLTGLKQSSADPR